MPPLHSEHAVIVYSHTFVLITLSKCLASVYCTLYFVFTSTSGVTVTFALLGNVTIYGTHAIKVVSRDMCTWSCT